MKFENMLAMDRGGGLWFKASGCGRARRVCGVGAAASRLRRTRRQVYRYIESGVLKPRGKILGEWLLDDESVGRLAESPMSVQPLPGRMRPLFPEYEVSSLNAGRDRALVISRVLENGTLADLRWLFTRYRPGEIARCLAEDGPRLLSPRSLRLWSLYFRQAPRILPSWRRISNPWARAFP